MSNRENDTYNEYIEENKTIKESKVKSGEMFMPTCVNCLNDLCHDCVQPQCLCVHKRRSNKWNLTRATISLSRSRV